MKRTACMLLLALASCRPDPGDSDYENHQPTNPDDPGPGGEDENLPGPFPFQAGQRRLSVGFYEGGKSEEIAINDTDTHVFLYEGTLTMETSTTRVEGKVANRVVHAGKTWLGFGIHWDAPHNLDGWKTLHVSLNSADPGFASVKIGMSDTQGIQVDVGKYGYVNDGQWHHVAIPVSEFTSAGVKLNAIQAPFVFIAGQGPAGNSLLFDNLYFTVD
ncbi:hypothetical protein LY474_39410 [Myxococcus stipitatus]|uniref:hypothetical protein n=1 Tax=Myxococcus stipitatus TaxID=83455 RepID=UPI001F2D0379|nr:hypothetical protein [Myxococcus stipitatus]MCE9673881.1 hypothetical protein [Myxococcus stipitatus]